MISSAAIIKRLAALASALAILAALVGAASAAQPIAMSISARDIDTASTVIGFTDEVPPFGVRQRHAERVADDGLEMELWGVELSAWQPICLPDDGRYLLNWDISYQGSIVDGRGRVGFFMGNDAASPFISVEVTRYGELRVLDWGPSYGGPLGKIKFSAKAAPNGVKDVRIDASYSIRDQIMKCRVNGGREIAIDMRAHGIVAPYTIKAAGYFAAVPEAERGMSRWFKRDELDIDISPRWTKVIHKELEIRAQK